MMKRKSIGIKGVCRIRLSSASPESLLNACAMNGLEIWDMVCQDSFTLFFSLRERDLPQLRVLAEKTMCDITVEEITGGSRLHDFLKAHLAFFAALALSLALLCASTFFIWDISVYGCDKLSQGQVLRALEACGVSHGSFWPGIDRELLRSEMLLELPELAWMTVNVRASRAQVLVSERQQKPEIYLESDPGHLVASETGIIKKVSALNGKVQTEAGSAVTEGEILVSAYMDSITAEPRRVRAHGEVIAETWHEINAAAPKEQLVKTKTLRPKTRIALKMGKMRINFYPSGRKTVDGYDKIIDNYIIGVEGVFALPLTVVVERLIPYEVQPTATDESEAIALRQRKSLEGSIDGEVLSCSVSSAEKDGLVLVSLRSACLENIARFEALDTVTDNMP